MRFREWLEDRPFLHGFLTGLLFYGALRLLTFLAKFLTSLIEGL